MSILRITILVFLISQTLQAADINLIKSGGKYYLLSKDTTGKPVNLPVTRIIDLDNSTTPEEPEPSDPFLDNIKLQTEAVLKAGGTPTTAAGISSVFSLAGDSLSNGTLKIEDAFSFLKFGLDKLFTIQPDKEKWAAFRADLSGALETLRQDGLLKTKEQYSSTFKRISSGMNAASGFNGNLTAPAQATKPGAALFGNIDIAKIIEFIKMLMEIWRMFQ